FTNGQLLEVGTFSNDSKVASSLGIPSLKQETSKSASVGFTYKIPSAKLTLTADGYFIRIDNRILLTGQFTRSAVSPATQLIYDAERVNAVQL
ncbi:TonB-dependent receptor, partial [Salmonella enterica subsp. enterica serovar Weltevreden]|nr:TonB-dependent receptor [Salmonella enterica subsp. enterica serovar Weltevreden]